MAQPIIEVQNLSKEYRLPDGRRLLACNKLELQIAAGQAVGIVGESGSGKSTLAKMLTLMLPPSAGDILYRGRSLLHLSKQEIWQLRPQIQMVFQTPAASINPKMKIVDVVTEPLISYKKITKHEKRAKAQELLAMVELPVTYLDRYAHHLSGGQCQRVSIARALALEPEILICDEATSALDVSVQKRIVELLLQLQKQSNMTLLFISHDLALVHSFADQIFVMKGGCLVDHLSAAKPLMQSKVAYTQALLQSVFSLEMVQSDLVTTTAR